MDKEMLNWENWYIEADLRNAQMVNTDNPFNKPVNGFNYNITPFIHQDITSLLDEQQKKKKKNLMIALSIVLGCLLLIILLGIII